MIVKKRFSAFYKTGLAEELRSREVEQVLIAGTQYPNCVRATASDAAAEDFDVVVLTDCCSARTDEVVRANVFDLRNMGIRCMTFAELRKEAS